MTDDERAYLAALEAAVRDAAVNWDTGTHAAALIERWHDTHAIAISRACAARARGATTTTATTED